MRRSSSGLMLLRRSKADEGACSNLATH
ncbi:unnamed protein product, partial [Didymodactylos carnosus]